MGRSGGGGVSEDEKKTSAGLLHPRASLDIGVYSSGAELKRAGREVEVERGGSASKQEEEAGSAATSVNRREWAGVEVEV
mmetsp:Transcript_14077/g.36140  ORF Transcript_14077/g.36140 Transcript_14077/m.36140 type:complete len:80 (+) Transcript_14077:3-242(+)